MIFNIDPMPKCRMTRADRWSQRPIVARYWAFKDQLVLEARKNNFTLGEKFSVVFEIPMPKSWSKKKKAEMVNTPHQGKKDLDNMIKSVMDSLCEEDSHIYYIEAEKIWAEEGSIIIENL